MARISEQLVEEVHKGIRVLNYVNRPTNLNQILQKSADLYPDKPVFECVAEEWTYRKFSANVNALAAAMQKELKIAKGDRVALLLNNEPAFPLVFFAVAKIGAVSVPINTRFVSKEIAYILKDSGAKVVLIHPDYWKEYRRARSSVPSVEHVVFAGSHADGEDALQVHELIRNSSGQPDALDIDEDDVASIFYTAGTTGKPKGAVCTHRNFSASSINVEMSGLTSDDRQLICVPLSHPLGCHSQMIGGVHLGATMVIQRHFNADETLNLIRKSKITALVGVPTIYWLLLAQMKLRDYNFDTLRNVIYGGSPASPELVRRLREAFPNARLGNGYGLTESSALATFLSDEYAMEKPDSVGPPVPPVQIRIVDDDGRDLPQGKIGEVLLKGPNIVDGYWKDAVGTRETFRDGWLYTGDVGRLDKEGFLYIVDRKKDMIIRGGENIYCVEIENVLESHPGVFEAAVISEPDRVFGEQVMAYIVPNSGHSLTVDEILDFCEEHLADFKIPKYVKLVENLPRTPAGKVDKRALRRTS